MKIVDAGVVVSRLFEIGKGYKGDESPYLAILDAIEAVEDAAVLPCDEPKQDSKPKAYKTNRDVLAEEVEE